MNATPERKLHSEFFRFSKVFYLAILSLHGFTNGGGLERVYGGNVLILSLIAEY